MSAEQLRWIQTTTPQLREAPLAKCGNEEMNALLERWDVLVEGLNEPLRVAILGEVKAGKSTLVNALIGSRVVPADVLEASAIVTILRHGPGLGSIHNLDGTVDTGDVAEIVAMIERHKGDLAFADRTSFAELELPLKRLEGLQILDTPGLAADSTLPKKTLERLAEYDIVVWVLNAGRQGDSLVLDEFDRVGALGKPILAVVNQVDKLPVDEVSRVLVKFERDLDVYAEEVIALSAKRAMEEPNGQLAELNSHLERYAQEPERAKVEASFRQFRALLEAAAHLHFAAAAHAEAESARIEAWERRIARAGDHVMEEADAAAMRWIRDKFMARQRAELETAAEAGARTLEAARRTIIVPEIMQEELDRLVEHLIAEIQIAWEREGAAISAELRALDADSNALVLEHLAQGDALLSRLSSGTTSPTSDLLVTGSMGAAAGAGIAAYVALIGPAAPIIYLSGALAAFVPPLLVGGLAAGTIKVLLTRNKNRERRKRLAAELLDRLREDFRTKVWVQQLRPGVRELTDRLTLQLRNTTPSSLLAGPSATPDELKAFADDLRADLKATSTL